MTNSIETALTNAIAQLASQALSELLSNPERIHNALASLFSSEHTSPEDVAQCALDASKRGHLSKAQALKIVGVCLDDSHTTVNTVGKRVDLPSFIRN